MTATRSTGAASGSGKLSRSHRYGKTNEGKDNARSDYSPDDSMSGDFEGNDSWSSESNSGNPGSLQSDIKDAAGAAVRAVGEQASAFAQDIGYELNRTAEGQMAYGAEAMQRFADAITTAADELKDQSPRVARYVSDAAERVKGVSQTISKRQVNDLVHAASDVARTQPMLFFGGAMAAGFALARFWKSSARNHAEPDPHSSAGRKA
jgi:hypothetical protein